MKLFSGLGLLCAGLMLGNILSVNVAVAASDAPGYPEMIEAYDPREMAMLPAYCKYTAEFGQSAPGYKDPAEGKKWRELLGPTFVTLHHYCWGLMHTNRALFLTRSAQQKNFHLSQSIHEFDYVLRRATADFMLLPEILTKRGENLIRLGKGPIAALDLERAIQLKPDYSPAYIALSDYHKNIGDVVKARELLQNALSFAPEARGLKKRLAALDAAKPQ
jgi:tetratricopeptide (TPR) repeat protein